MPLFPACTVPRCKGRMLKTYTDKTLHTQLLFYKSLFDTKWAKSKIEADNKRRVEKIAMAPLSPDEQMLYDSLTAQAARALALSAYNTVDFGTLFAPVCQTVEGSPERA